jgi:hypothetical protein
MDPGAPIRRSGIPTLGEPAKGSAPRCRNGIGLDLHSRPRDSRNAQERRRRISSRKERLSACFREVFDDGLTQLDQLPKSQQTRVSARLPHLFRGLVRCGRWGVCPSLDPRLRSARILNNHVASPPHLVRPRAFGCGAVKAHVSIRFSSSVWRGLKSRVVFG